MNNSYDLNSPIPIERRIENAYKSKNGLYPHEILLISYAPRYIYGEEIQTDYWWYSFGIDNVSSVLDSLLQRKFLSLGDLNQTVNKRTVPELKTFLKANGLTVGGKKADLINRIFANIPINNIEDAFPERYYCQTELGKKELEENDYLFEVKKNNYGISVWDANRILFRGSPKSFYELMLDRFERKLLELSDSDDFKKITEYLKWKVQLSNYHGKYDNVISDVSKIAFLEINGASRTQSEYFKYSIKNIFPYNSNISFLKLQQDTKNWFINLKSILGISNEDIKHNIISANESANLKLEIFTKEECAKIVILEMEGEIDEIKKIYSSVEKRLQDNNPELFMSDDSSTHETDEECKEKEYKSKMKSAKEKILLDSFNVLKQNVSSNHEQLAKILAQLQEIQPELSIELWKYLLEENWNSVVNGTEEYDSIAYYLTNDVVSEMTDSSEFEKTEKFFLSEMKVLQAVFEYTPKLDTYITGIVGIQVRKKNFEIANKIFELMFSNKKNDFFDKDSYCYYSYSGIFKNIIEDYVLTNKSFPRQSVYCRCSNVDEEIFEFLKYWADQIYDETEKARVYVFLSELI